MKNLNLENFKAAIRINDYPLNTCSLCGYWMSYFYQGDKIVIDTGCDCVTYSNIKEVSDLELQSMINCCPEKVNNFINNANKKKGS